MDRLLEATFAAEQRHFWFRGFRRFVRPLVAAAAHDRTDATILDCGCGTGANLLWLNDFGTAFGAELAWTGLRFATQAGRRRLIRASVASLPVPGSAFDVVTSFDVLYCLSDRDEAAAAAEMFRVLKPGGAAVVNVAAMPVLTGNHSVLSNEVRRYDRCRLRKLLEGAGFAIERLTYTNFTLFIPLFLLRSGQRLLGLAPEEKAEREVSVPPAPINTLLAGLLQVEARIASRVSLPCGSSLLCLARKRA